MQGKNRTSFSLKPPVLVNPSREYIFNSPR
jgi:hypothetical protein